MRSSKERGTFTICVGSGDVEKVTLQREERTKAMASEKVGKDLEYQAACLTFTRRLKM